MVALVGSPASAVVSRDLATEPAEFVAYGSKNCDRTGLSMAIGDVNGDGIGDVASGAPLDEQGAGNWNQGALHVYFGFPGFSGVRDAAQPGSPDLIVYGQSGTGTVDDQCNNKKADVLGKGVAVGDVNGDGLNDLLTSALRADGLGPGQSDFGRVYVFYGRMAWPSVIDLASSPNLADVTIGGDVQKGDFGIHLAAKDFDNDGFDDILIGAPAVLANTTQPGGLRVVYGSASLPSTIQINAPPVGVRTFVVNGEVVGDKLGHGVAADDLNNDGIADMVGGAPLGEGPCGAGGGGKAYVFYGSSSSPLTGTWNLAATPAPLTVVSGEGGDQMGRRLHVGDVSGDGMADLILGARCADGPGGRINSGAAHVLFGPLGMGTRNLGSQPADFLVYGADAGDELGVGPGSGDVSGDGNGDLILGASEADGPTNDRDAAGEAVVLFGPVGTGTRDLASSPADVTIHSPDQGDKMGRFVATGDVSGDGVPDLAVTAYFAKGFVNTTDWKETGEVHVLTSLAGGNPTLTVTVDGTGSGTVTGTGISCPGDCSETYPPDTMVTLTAAADAGSSFVEWSGACTGTAATCDLTMDASKSVTATFDTAGSGPFTLTVTKDGTGQGQVKSADGGIKCGSDCTETYTSGAMVALTATPKTGSSFGGWSGACTGLSTTCNVTMDADKAVTATFDSGSGSNPTLTVTMNGTGSGTVTGPGITCPGDCIETYAAGTMVTLTAAAGSGSTFDGWGGACAGTAATCDLTMDASKSVTATFDSSGGPTCTITGTEGSDVVKGTAGDDVICLLGGNDKAKGLGGNDIIFGGDGNDEIYGGAGADELNGEGGDDLLDGADGFANDTLDGGTGTNTCVADPGDTLVNCS
jgi:hypothetical protein